MPAPPTDALLRRYLSNPCEATRPHSRDSHFHTSFLITFLGSLFVRGYRIMEQRDNVLLLSLMEYHTNDQISSRQSRASQKLPSRFRVVMWEVNNNEVYMDGAARRRKYELMAAMGKWVEEKEYNIVFLNSFTCAVPSEQQVEAGESPTKTYSFYRSIDWIQRFNGNRHVAEKDEGTAMHELAEILIKGAGEARNADTMARLQRENKYTYDLFKVVNTINFIVGREILENGFETMSAEKWMRKSTEKKFKRFDLLLRNENRCKIIDWKFTKLVAEEKIKGSSIARKNKIYYQLAAKDYRTSIELQFYCFHEKDTHEFHDFTTAHYHHNIEQISIPETEKKQDVAIEEERPRRRGQGRERSRDRGAIEIEDSEGEMDVEEIDISSGSSSVEIINRPPNHKDRPRRQPHRSHK